VKVVGLVAEAPVQQQFLVDPSTFWLPETYVPVPHIVAQVLEEEPDCGEPVVHVKVEAGGAEPVILQQQFLFVPSTD
jgi:hypothetical protein